MADRREDERSRTDRPDAADVPGDRGLPTLAEVLDSPALAAGAPDVLVGGAALSSPVRWVHVSDSPGVARLLEGGELLLTTASAWPAEPADLRTLVRDFVRAGLVGIVIELGVHYRYVPTVVVEAAGDAGLPLIALHREIKFVSVTEEVHRRIIDDQTAALRARDDVRTLFTSLALRGAPADYVVERLAHTLRAPVVLESLAHEVIVAELADADPAVLDDWQERSRRFGDGDDGRSLVPVEARGIRWATLVALAGPGHPAGRRAVLEQGATALALGRLADPDGEDWARLGRRRLMDALLGGRYGSADEVMALLGAARIDLRGAALFGLAVEDAAAADVEAAAIELGGRALCATPRGAGERADGWMPVLLAVPSSTTFAGAAAERFRARLRHDGSDPRLTVGPRVDGEAGAAAVPRLLDSLEQSLDLADVGDVPEGSVQWVVRHPLLRFVSSLRGDHRLLEHSEDLLAPVLAAPPARRRDLLAALAAITAHPGNRTAAAAAAHVSRSVFYQRLDLAERVLGVDLDDGEVLAALHLALVVHRAHRSPDASPRR
ncbi:PucR family transcriptional regulator [Microbacterium sp. RURRCA19A]|uniref:PucR family transcriptional regulator n=1 Tax=Microbacterium sp. RURRCA19A TaxID=1907391 RepID=UPI0009543183|nr:PucR family transcriptional regulator [Microbacterium sp. RURRCA19A]SIR64008.1 purine catabolism regulatory protein [Microbacterium sp. RURRCA19A]